MYGVSPAHKGKQTLTLSIDNVDIERWMNLIS